MNIIGLRKIWYLISAILVLPGIIALFVWGLKPGIDFRGGTQMEIKFNQDITTEQIRDGLSELNLSGLSIQATSQETFFLKTTPIDQETHLRIQEALAKIGENQAVQELSFETVGPTVSDDLTRKAIIAVILASLAIIFYIAFAFRQVPRPASSWSFGVSAVFGLVHDLAFIIGLWAILGHFFGYEIDSLFITGLLTIMGFSVHDTIVVFDRIRENLRKHPSLSFEENANNSIIQTLNRSLNTSFTVVIVLGALYFLGGETLKQFVLMLLVGIIIGTYSSIFNASPLLVSWHGWRMSRAKQKDAS